MARPIAPTPTLDAKATKKFLEKVERNLKKKADYIPTPKLEKAVEKILANGQYEKK